MPLYRIAGLPVEILPKSERLFRFLSAYRTEATEAPLFSVTATKEMLVAERRLTGLTDAPDDILEISAVHREVIRKILPYNAFFLHAAVVARDGAAYAISAPSGTGKSTHVALWRRAFGDSVSVVNGDKPLVALDGDRFLAWGTPWCGKENWNENRAVPLSAIAFLERSEENRIERLTPDEALSLLLPQVILPDDRNSTVLWLSLLEKFLTTVPAYRLYANVTEDAARLAYETMKGNEQ